MPVARGTPVHGEFGSADASALSEPNARVLLYGAGSTTAVTLASTDQLVITDILVVSGATLTVTVYDGADNSAGAGEVILRGNFTANGGVSWQSITPHYCQKGSWAKVKTSGAGQVDCFLRGTVIGS